MTNSSADFGVILKRHFDPTVAMLERVIEACPDDVWAGKDVPVPFWQQIYHTITGIEFWFRKADEKFVLPDFNKEVTPDLAIKSSAYLTKAEMKEYVHNMQRKSDEFFAHVSTKLFEPAGIYNKLLNTDIILMQIRHFQHHIGYCNRMLKEHGVTPVEWMDYEV